MKTAINRLAFGTLVGLVLSASVHLCAGAPAAPAPSTSIATTPGASIHGSRTKKSIFTDAHIACVAAVDRQPIPKFEAGWRKDRALDPGKHFISLRYFHRTEVGKCVLELNVKPETRYEVRFNSSDRWVDLWIVDLSTGEPVTKVTRIKPAYEAGRDLSRIPWVGSSDANMPDPALMAHPGNQSPQTSAWAQIPN